MSSLILNSVLNKKLNSSSGKSSTNKPLASFHHAVKHLSEFIATNCFKSLSFVQIIQLVPSEFNNVDQ